MICSFKTALSTVWRCHKSITKP